MTDMASPNRPQGHDAALAYDWGLCDNGYSPYWPGIPCCSCGKFVGRDGHIEVEHFEMSSEVASVDGTCRECLITDGGRSLATDETRVAALAPRRIYVASSWRNPWQPSAVELLRELGNEVYDFRNPRPGDTGFAWSSIDPEWLAWQPEVFRDCLRHPVAQEGFKSDFDAMEWADTFVLLLPCGRSAHLEAGWAIGAGKPTCVVLHEDKFEPELMYLLAPEIVTNIEDAAVWVECLRVPEAVAA